MSESKHSPGPWRWKKDLGYCEQEVLLDRDGNCVCDFGSSEQYYPVNGREPSSADARLIAAAPAMLAMLWRLRRGMVPTRDLDVLLASIDGKVKP